MFGDGIFGDATANQIDGGLGNDTLSGRGGNDGLTGGAGNDVIYGGDGADWLVADAGADRLIGDAGADVLIGGDGIDTLEGGGGTDTLFGGSGADQFRHDGLVADGFDWVMDYVAGQGDTLVFNIAGASRAQFSVSYALIEGAGGASAEALITYLPTGQQLWSITDGALMTEIMLRLGASTFDLV